MKIFSVSDDDLQLLNAVKPFMSSKSQNLIDMTITILNVFKPTKPEKKINIDALSELLSMVHESFEVKKDAVINQYEAKENDEKIDPSTKDVENLLHLLANKKDSAED
jgi:hypothetical protein